MLSDVLFFLDNEYKPWYNIDSLLVTSSIPRSGTEIHILWSIEQIETVSQGWMYKELKYLLTVDNGMRTVYSDWIY